MNPFDFDIPDRRPREPDDMIDYHSCDPYEVESEDDYRCPHCGYIGTATLHIARDPGGRECVDVECRGCGADTLDEIRDISTRSACDRCSHAYVEHEQTDYCYTCGIAVALDDVRVEARTARAINDDVVRLIREITLDQVRL